MSIWRVILCFIPILAACALVMLLEERAGSWLLTGRTDRPTGSPRASAGPRVPGIVQAPAPGGPVPLASPPSVAPMARLKIVLEPAQIGRPESAASSSGDRWDPLAGSFLAPYRSVRRNTEDGLETGADEYLMSIARRTQQILALTTRDDTWPKFAAMVNAMGTDWTGPLPRVRLESQLGRDRSWRESPTRHDPDSNREFRLFDGPDRTPVTSATLLVPGRLGALARLAADLVIDLDLDDTDPALGRGPMARFVPGPRFYEQGRKFALNTIRWTEFRLDPTYGHWSAGGRGGDRRDRIISEVQRYFIDSQPIRNRNGERLWARPRPEGVSWAHRQPGHSHPGVRALRDPVPSDASAPSALAGPFQGPFWDRERSAAESWRREGGPEGLGGDNLAASQDLVRFIRTALVRAEDTASTASTPVPKAPWLAPVPGSSPQPSSKAPQGPRKGAKATPPRPETPDDDLEAPDPDSRKVTSPSPRASVARPVGAHQLLLGEGAEPLAGDFAVPWLCDSVVASLRLGVLSDDRDVWLLEHRVEAISRGLALGIYSLASGVNIRPVVGVNGPRGHRIPWERYREARARAKVAPASGAAPAAPRGASSPRSQ